MQAKPQSDLDIAKMQFEQIDQEIKRLNDARTKQDQFIAKSKGGFFGAPNEVAVGAAQNFRTLDAKINKLNAEKRKLNRTIKTLEAQQDQNLSATDQ